MARFIRKIGIVDAMRFSGDVGEIIDWARSLGKSPDSYPMSPFGGHCLSIGTPEGEMLASPGFWIIRGAAGEFYPCRNDIFMETYEPVDP